MEAIINLNNIIAGVVAKNEDELPDQIALLKLFLNQASISGYFDMIH